MSDKKTRNKVALVTGAARGIGRAIAETLAGIGFDIAVADVLDSQAAAETMENCSNRGAGTCYIQADISRAGDRQRIIAEVRAAFGRLDLLVNNAGVAPKVRADILEATEESYDRVMNINLKGPYFLSQAAANWMIQQKQADDSITPMIINIASMSSYTSSPSRGEYCLSKAGVSMMTKLFADRLADDGILVFEIRPGIIQTDMTAGVKAKYDKLIAEGITPIRRWGQPGDIARAVQALAESYLPFSTGQVINVDGGYHFRRL